jgi:hypothetical protein
MVIVNNGEYYKFVGEREDIDQTSRGIASLALAAYDNPKFKGSHAVLDDLVLESIRWGQVYQGQWSTMAAIYSAREELQNSREATLIAAARKGHISPANIYAEVTDMNATDETFVVRPDGLAIEGLDEFNGYHGLDRLVHSEPHDDLEAERIPEGLNVTTSAIQYELVEDEYGHPRLLSDRQHTSLGIGYGDTYLPIATALSSSHPVMEMQQPK